jgi:hypothetical protein
VSAELAARRTAAAAVLADFRRDANAFIHDDSLTLPTPDYCGWAFRLSSELQSVLDQLPHEPDPVAPQLEQIRLVLDHFDWETDDRQYALEQIDDILRSAP